MSRPRPSVGRVVHYLSRGSADGAFPPACRAAVITEVFSPADLGISQAMLDNPETRESLPVNPVSLAVVNPTGLFFDQQIEYDEDATLPGTWHWPEHGPTWVGEQRPELINAPSGTSGHTG